MGDSYRQFMDSLKGKKAPLVAPSVPLPAPDPEPAPPVSSYRGFMDSLKGPRIAPSPREAPPQVVAPPALPTEHPAAPFQSVELAAPMGESWWKNFSHNILHGWYNTGEGIAQSWEGTKEAWADPHWWGKPIAAGKALWTGAQVALAPLSAVAAVVPAGVMAAFGHTQDANFFDLSRRAAYHAFPGNSVGDWVGTLGTEALGFGADVIADPLTYATAGGKPLFNAVAKILKMNPVPLNRAADAATEAARRYRMFGEITPEAIQEGSRLHVLNGLAEEGVAEGFGNRKFHEWMFGEQRHQPVSGVNASFEDYLGVARRKNLKELEQHLEMPTSLKRPAADRTTGAMPTFTEAQQAQDLAHHLAAIEAHAWEGRPKLRFFGQTVANWSPTEATARGFSKLSGKWKQQALPTAEHAVLDEHVPGFSGAVESVLRNAQLPYSREMNLHEVENMYAASQMGHLAAKKGAAEDVRANIVREMGIAYQQTGKWTKNVFGKMIVQDPITVERLARRHVLTIAPQDRVAELQNIKKIYQGFQKAAELEPGAFFSQTAKAYERAVQSIDRMLGRQDIMNRLLSRRQVPLLRNTIERRLQSTVQALQDMIAQQNLNWNTLTAGATSGTATVNQLARSLGEAAHLRNMTVGQSGMPVQSLSKAMRERTIPQLITDVHTLYDTLANLSIPFKYGTQHRQNILNAWQHVQDSRPVWESLQGSLRQFFERGALTQGPMDDIWALAKSINTKHGHKVWKDLADSLQLSGPFVLPTNHPQLGNLAAKARDELIQKITARSYPLSQHEADEAVRVLRSLSDESMGPIIYAFRELGALRRQMGTGVGILNEVTGPYENGLRLVEEFLNTSKDVDINRIMADFGQHQAHYELHDFIRNGHLKKFYDQIDRTKEWALSKFNFAPHVFRLLEETNDGFYQAPRDAKRWALEEINGKLADKANQLLQRDLTTDELLKANEALGKVIGAERCLQYRHVIPSFQQSVREIATRSVTDGMAELSNVFGAHSNTVLQDMKTLVYKHLREMAEEEAKRGKYSWDPHRLPIHADLSRAERDMLQHNFETDEIFKAIRRKEKPGEFIWQDAFPEGFPEFEAWVKHVNSMRRGIDIPSEPVYNLTAMMGHRRYNHIRTKIANEYHDRLQAALPHYAQYQIHTKLSPREETGGWIPVANLGGQYAKMAEAEHWHVPLPLFRYLKNNSGSFNNMEHVLSFVQDINKAMFRLSVSFNLVHLKNIAALAYTAKVDPKKIYEYAKWMMENPQKVARPHWAHPLDKFKYALDEHPDMVEAKAAGIAHFDPHENMPVHKQLRMEMGEKPPQTVPERIQGFSGPATTFIFDIVDKLNRVALYKQFRELGLTARESANLSNHYMVDYSTRFLSPQARSLGHMMFPFFGWRVGNMTLHVPNMLQNPALYAIEAHARDAVNQVNRPTELGDPDLWAKVLTYSVATPFTYGDNGYYAFVMPQMPWYPYMRMLESAAKENPMSAGAGVLGQVARWTRWYNAARWVTDQKLRERQKKDPTGVFFGTASDPGFFEEWLWGFRPFENMIRATYHRASPADFLWSAAGLVTPVEKVGYSPSARKVKPVEAEGVIRDMFDTLKGEP